MRKMRIPQIFTLIHENSSKGITDTYKQGMKKGVNLVIT